MKRKAIDATKNIVNRQTEKVKKNIFSKLNPFKKGGLFGDAYNVGPDAIMNSIVGKSAPLGGLQPFLDTMPRTMTPRQLNDKLNRDGLNGLYNVELDRPSIVGMGPYKTDGVNIQNPDRPADRTRPLTPLP